MLTVLVALCAQLVAAPPPELTLLRETYEKAVAAQVTGPQGLAVAELNKKFTAGLDRAISEAKAAGKLGDIIAIEADKKRIADGTPIPDDDDSTPAALKTLRGIYRAQLTKIDDARAAAQLPLLTAMVAKLKALETTLTKADRVDDAKEVLAYREGLANGSAPSTVPSPAVALASTPSTIKPAEPASGQPAAKAAKDDPALCRQLAEWAISNGHYVVVKPTRGGNATKVDALQSLPKGSFVIEKLQVDTKLPVISAAPIPWKLFQGAGSLTSLFIDTGKTGQTISMPDIGNLAGLSNLGNLEFGALMDKVIVWQDFDGKKLPHMPSLTRLIVGKFVRDADLADVHAAFPGLELITLSYKDFPPDEFEKLKRWKNLKALRLDGDSANITLAHVEVLAGLSKLRMLNFYPFGARIDPSLSRLRQIEEINLSYDCSAETFKVLSSLPGVLKFSCRSNSKLTSGDFAALTAMPALETLVIVDMKSFDDAALLSLSGLKHLTNLDLSGAGITDAALETLKDFKKLKSLVIKSTSLSDASIAAFKKRHPDVKVEK